MCKKIRYILLSVMLILFFNIQTVNATSFKASLNTTEDTIAPGQDLVVSFVVSNIDVSGGIMALQGVLEFDSNVLTYSNMTPAGGWGVPTYNASNGKFTVESSQPILTEQEVFRITFKVKEDLEDNTKTKISVKDLFASEGETKIESTAVEKEITIKKEDEGNQNPNNNAGENGSNQNNNSGNNGNNQNLGNNNNSETNNGKTNNGGSQTSSTTLKADSSSSANNKIPYTGLKEDLIIGSIILLILIAFISYKKMKKYRGI